MAFNWLFTNSTKNMLVKIVHPGGHVELHDRPVLAAEILLRNPRCCVAHPHVFKQPWAIVTPETTLMPGQKFYVVPISTIRKLQKLALKYSPCLVQEIQTSQSCEDEGEDRDGKFSKCCLFKNRQYSCLKQSDEKRKKPNSSDDDCFTSLLTVTNIKASTEDSSEETRSSSSIGNSSEMTALTRKRSKDGTGKGTISLDHWQPSLESIREE